MTMTRKMKKKNHARRKRPMRCVMRNPTRGTQTIVTVSDVRRTMNAIQTSGACVIVPPPIYCFLSGFPTAATSFGRPMPVGRGR
jgi:hypothetical protein